jgi:PAS domain S-box-containing protein
MALDLSDFAKTLVSSMSEAVILSDADGVIQWWNSGSERLFGYSSIEAIGQSLDIIIPENLRNRHWEGFHKTMQTGKSRYGVGDLLSVPAIRKDGGRISVDFTIVLFRDRTGVVTGIAAVMRDVTKQFQEMRTLRKQLVDCMAATRQS